MTAMSPSALVGVLRHEGPRVLLQFANNQGIFEAPNAKGSDGIRQKYLIHRHVLFKHGVGTAKGALTMFFVPARCLKAGAGINTVIMIQHVRLRLRKLLGDSLFSTDPLSGMLLGLYRPFYV